VWQKWGATPSRNGSPRSGRCPIRRRARSNRLRSDRRARSSQKGFGEPLGFWPGVRLGRAPMHKLNCVNGLAALLAFVGPAGADALGAELEGALQYPPRSVGEDAQPPPPARMLPQPVSPWRVELGVSGLRKPPSTQRFFILRLGPREIVQVHALGAKFFDEPQRQVVFPANGRPSMATTMGFCVDATRAITSSKVSMLRLVRNNASLRKSA
jgi:hypothetical protein